MQGKRDAEKATGSTNWRPRGVEGLQGKNWNRYARDGMIPKHVSSTYICLRSSKTNIYPIAYQTAVSRYPPEAPETKHFKMNTPFPPPHTHKPLLSSHCISPLNFALVQETLLILPSHPHTQLTGHQNPWIQPPYCLSVMHCLSQSHYNSFAEFRLSLLTNIQSPNFQSSNPFSTKPPGWLSDQITSFLLKSLNGFSLPLK